MYSIEGGGMKVFVGADIGTTGIRAGVYDEAFNLLGSGSGKSLVKRGRSGEIIQDADEMYMETAAAVKEAVGKAGCDPEQVACLSFDGQMAGVMGIDEDWNALTPYDSWLDTRCSSQVSKISEKARDLVVNRTGIIPSYNHGPKILWWKEEEPGIYGKIRSFVQPAAYVAGRLCGLHGEEAFIDWTYIHFSGYADNRRLRWDDELTGLLGIDPAKLPRIVSPMDIVGHTGGDASPLFGVPAGTPVAAGCGDTASCFLGTGAVRPGVAVDVAGTASVLALATDRFIADTEGLVYSSRSVVEDTWYTMSYINGGGLNLEWYRENFASGRSFEELDRDIEDLAPGSDGLVFIPHLEGRAYPNDPNMRGQWWGFTRAHTGLHFYRSVLEGIAYEYALYMERILKNLSGETVYDIRGVAGGAKSAVWCQMKADILGCNYSTINREDISILGQALNGAAAVQGVTDVRQAAEGIIGVKKTYSPDEGRHEAYRPYIDRYRELLSGE
jgi:xylulokinase